MNDDFYEAYRRAVRAKKTENINEFNTLPDINRDVEHPDHYTQHPSGVECIQIVEGLPFAIGNVVKYIWRYDRKNGTVDLEKAVRYIGYTKRTHFDTIMRSAADLNVELFFKVLQWEEPESPLAQALTHILNAAYGHPLESFVKWGNLRTELQQLLS